MRTLPDRLLVAIDKGACLAAGRTPLDLAAAALDGGARWLWYRNWIDALAVRRIEAAQLAERAAAAGAVLSVGGEGAAELAAELLPRRGTVGVHFHAASPSPSSEAEPLRAAPMGRSCHDLAEIRRAEADGLDYATLSPVFLTVSPKVGGRAPLGLAFLAGAADVARLPVLALGGITPARVASCLLAGARGVAVLGFVVQASEPARAVRALREALAEAGP